MDEKLLILGASGQGKVAADIALKSEKYSSIAFLDDADMEQCLNLPVIGKCGEACNYLNSREIFVAIGNASVRKRFVIDLMKRGAKIATLVHPSAAIGQNVQIGAGTIIMAGAVLNPECRIGTGCIVNTCASIDHDCMVGDYVHVSVGAHIAGTVTIGEGTWIGAGAVVNNNLYITEHCMIGSGAVVVKDINTCGIYVGIPAREMYMKIEAEAKFKDCSGGGKRLV